MKISYYNYSGVNKDGTFSNGDRGVVATGKYIQMGGSMAIRFHNGLHADGTVKGVTVQFESEDEKEEFIQAVKEITA